jgi:pilus assembly protein FimV
VNETNCSKFKKRAAALAVASCLSLAPWIAEAAGLGKLTVLSGLGQPLRAEVEIGANRDELSGMTARLAPQDAFRQAGVDFASVLLDLRFAIEKRPNGQAVVKVTSFKPVNEPFLDFLVELNWPAGRLVREYTFLLDPPEIAVKQAARSVAEARVVETVQGGGAMVERPTPARSSARAPTPKVAGEPQKADASGTRVVRPGETLRKIATETKHDGVSLEQMLVGLFQKNPDAFIGDNVNRLKAGAILGIPERAAVEAVSDAEAKKIYVAQAADWNAYRQKLAATTAKASAKEESVSQSSSGKITAKVEEKAAPVQQGKDQVKVSPTELAASSAAASKAAADSEADKIAKGKALKEAQDRLALLEKNVLELQKLVEMKNQKLAELQQQTTAKKEEIKPVEPPKQPEPAKVVEAAKPPEQPKPAEPVEPTKVAEEAKPVEKAPEVPKPVEPLPKAPVSPPVPEPEAEPGFIDSLLEDPLPLAAGGGILALLAGYFFYKRRRGEPSSLETTAAPGPSSLGPNSVFRMTGGQSVDTGNTAPQTGDFSQTGPGTIDTDEVDPVAEADVYMAYGRDTQAEEILLEALQKDPQRTAIHAKLLEIYANRRSLKQFETLASELYAHTGGVGADWEKVAALGVGLDPANPLYSGSRGQTESFDPDATMIVAPDNTGKATLAMPGELAQLAEVAPSPENVAPPDDFETDTLLLAELADIEPVAEPAAEPEATDLTADTDLMSLDFDLGSPELTPEVEFDAGPVAAEEPVDTSLVVDTDDALDFDLGVEAPTPAPEPMATDVPVDDLHVADELKVDEVDFDLPAAEALSLPEVTGEDAHDFSPEGTLVMPSGMEDAASTYVGGDTSASAFAAERPYQEEPPMVDFDLDMDASATETSINPISANREDDQDSATETVVAPNSLAAEVDFDNPQLANTMVNTGVLDADSLEFDVKLTDSVFLGQPMMPTDFDIGSINLDLAAEAPTEVAAQPAEPEPAVPAQPEAVSQLQPPPVETAPQAPVQDSQWEEVNTKLDLAKAYEEMGDLEGARELLQEVVGEGPVDLVEQARAILGRIGE